MLSVNLNSMKLGMEQFSLYLKESTSMPKLWIKDKGDGSSSEKNVSNKEKIPSTLSLLTFLISKLKFTEEEAWNTAYCKAVWYSIAYSAQEGSEIEIITTDDEENASSDVATLDEIERKSKEGLQ